MPVPDQPAESENASTGDRSESEAASAILASVKEQVGRAGSPSAGVPFRMLSGEPGRPWPRGSRGRPRHVCYFNNSVRTSALLRPR